MIGTTSKRSWTWRESVVEGTLCENKGDGTTVLDCILIRTAYKDTKLNSIGWKSNRIAERWVTEELRRYNIMTNSYKIVLIRTCRDVTRDTTLSKMCKLNLIRSCSFIN